MPPNTLIVIAIIGMMCLALGVVLFVILYQRRFINHQIQLRELNLQKQSELMQASVRGEEDERMRIAAELHDDVGATLASVRLYLTQAARKPGDMSLITQSKDLLDESIRKIRDISHQLQPGILQYLGLIKALQSLAETLTRAGSIKVDFESGGTDWPDLAPQTELSVYRIVQELTNNIIRHAGADKIHIMTEKLNSSYCLRLTHNGNGLSEAEYDEQLYKKGAIGLKNIDNRLKSSRLSLIFPDPQQGLCTIILCLPGTGHQCFDRLHARRHH